MAPVARDLLAKRKERLAFVFVASNPSYHSTGPVISHPPGKKKGKRRRMPRISTLASLALIALMLSSSAYHLASAELSDPSSSPMDVVITVEWSAPTTLSHLQRLTPPTPADVARVYARYLRDQLAVKIVYNESASHSIQGQRMSHMSAYRGFDHPTSLSARQRAVLTATIHDTFGQFQFDSNNNNDAETVSKAAGRRLHGRASPKSTGKPRQTITIGELEKLTRTWTHSIESELLAENGGSDSKKRTFRGFIGADGKPTSFQVTPKLTIRVARDIKMRRTAATSEWHLDRIDQANLPLNGQWNLPNDIPTANITDQSWVYVVDGGILLSHQELSPRASDVYDEYPDLADACDAHGTHVSSLAVGKTVGVNPHARVFDVRVLDCAGSGTLGGLLRGLDEINEHCSAAGGGARRSIVVNLSLGASGTAASAEGRALAAELADLRNNCDAIIVASAGNAASDACYTLPAALVASADGGVVTVGASNIFDNLASYSNYGPCVAIHAPGSDIRGALSSGDTAYGKMSGTSMASPIVAGVASLHTARRERWYNLFPQNLYSDVVYEYMVVSQSVKSKINLSTAATLAGTTRNLIQRPTDASSSDPDGIVIVIPPPSISDRGSPDVTGDPDDASTRSPSAAFALLVATIGAILVMYM
jgi:subtilisin family serine protease